MTEVHSPTASPSPGAEAVDGFKHIGHAVSVEGKLLVGEIKHDIHQLNQMINKSQPQEKSAHEKAHSDNLKERAKHTVTTFREWLKSRSIVKRVSSKQDAGSVDVVLSKDYKVPHHDVQVALNPDEFEHIITKEIEDIKHGEASNISKLEQVTSIVDEMKRVNGLTTQKEDQEIAATERNYTDQEAALDKDLKLMAVNEKKAQEENATCTARIEELRAEIGRLQKRKAETKTELDNIKSTMPRTYRKLHMVQEEHSSKVKELQEAARKRRENDHEHMAKYIQSRDNLLNEVKNALVLRKALEEREEHVRGVKSGESTEIITPSNSNLPGYVVNIKPIEDQQPSSAPSPASR